MGNLSFLKKAIDNKVYITYNVYNVYIQFGGLLMDIIISNSAGKPIYEQISSQIKEMIMNGTLKEGDPLPSMRNLAKQLRISIITTKRAYEELERDGFIESFTGKGSFVIRQDQDFVREEGLRQIEEYLTNAAEKAKQCGVEYKELAELLEMIYKGE